MFMIDLVRWRYAKGWGIFIDDFRKKLGDTADFFSIGQLLRTLFMPYRQISANANQETSGTVMNAFFDRLVSRIVGFFTRLFIIIFGSIAMLLELVIGTVLIILWPAMPALVVVGVVLSVVGVTL